MTSFTRKEFLTLGAFLAGMVGLRKKPSSPVPLAQRGPGIEADLIVVNGRVLTQDDAVPRAEAFAVKNDRFLAVGSNADIRNLASSRTRVLDAARMTVVPGFIDCHCHPSGVNELYEANANVRTLAELQANLRRRAAETPTGFWVTGAMFDDTKLDRALTRRELDAVSTQHPIAVNHRGGHTSWYNSKALELAGITRETKDPPDGRFFRDETGDLTGRVAELARGMVTRSGQRERFTDAQRRERSRKGMAYISELLTAAGLTSVHDAGATTDHITAFEDVYRGGELRHRSYLMVRGGAFPQLRDAGVYTGLGDEWVRIGGVKFAADGSASERTMRMSTPYVGTNDIWHSDDDPGRDPPGGRRRPQP